MDELEIKGKKYISSRRAAELTGYAKDYVGQLARAGKIMGTRMGRAWYVEEASLLAHAETDATQDTKYDIQDTEEVPAPTPSPIQIQRPEAPRRFVSTAVSFPSSWVPATYSSDDSELMLKPVKEFAGGSLQVAFKEEPASIASPISEELETAVRIKILEHRMQPQTYTEPPRTTFRIAEKANEIKTRKKKSSKALSLGALTAALGIFAFFSSGWFFSSQISFRGTNGSSTASIIGGFEQVRDVLLQYPAFQVGVDTIGGFFHLLFSSFVDFFTIGWNFILLLFARI